MDTAYIQEIAMHLIRSVNIPLRLYLYLYLCLRDGRLICQIMQDLHVALSAAVT